MPRNFLISLLSFLSLCLIPPERLAAFEPVNSRMSDRLYGSLINGKAEDFLSVIVYLWDDFDLQNLENRLALASAGRKQRHREVVSAMLAAAGQAQGPVLELLRQAAAAGDVRSYQPYWVNDCIALTGRVSFITALSARPEIEYMTHDRVYSRRDPVERAAEMFAVPNQDSLRARSWPIFNLGLDILWDYGLTGKGILICDIGSGIDGRHPLLAPKWRGNNGGTSAESWFDPVDGSSVPFDDEPNTPSHDTAVMGLMVAGERSLGVAYEAQWIGAKIFDNQNLTNEGRSSTKDSWVIAAFQWALDPDGNPETTVDVPDVINNSYGTTGEFQEDICRQTMWRMIDRVEAAGTVVVFSAGNEGPDPFTTGSPASRALSPLNVFAVGSVDFYNRMSNFSSRGPSACDSTSIKPNICAPGSEIVAITGSEYAFGYIRVDGTSFSCPYVAGIIALMRQANPTLTPDEIKQLILDTALDFGQFGPDYAYGYGIINPVGIFGVMAVPDHPILYTKRVEIDDRQGGNGNGYVEQGERISLVVPVFNSGTDVRGIRGAIRTSNQGVVLLDSAAVYGDIRKFDGRENRSDPFVIEVLPQAAAGSQLLLYLDLVSGDGAYSQTLQVTLPIAPAVEGLATHDAGSFRLSFTNYGQFGGNIGRAGSGEGLRYPKDAPYTMLYRGALLVGTSSLKVSDGVADFDFAPGPGGPLQMTENSPRADQMSISYIREKSAGTLNAIGVELKQTTLVWRASPNNDFLIFEYRVLNPHPATIKNLFIGLYADWDIPDSLPSRNAVGYDAGLKLGYIHNPQEPKFGYGGLALVSGHNVSGHRAISNWRYIHSGYSDNIAYAFMSGGLASAASDTLDDWSQVLASGPHTIAPGDSLTIAWALLVGDDLADLVLNTQAALSKYQASLALASLENSSGAEAPHGLPRAFKLGQNTPNPFNPSTTITYTLPETARDIHVRLTVFDLRGRVIAELVNRTQSGGSYLVNWEGTVSGGSPAPSGVYFYRLEAGGFSAVRKMVLIK